MKVLDLFSGIGGFSLGLERAGMTTAAFCEIEPYCRAVLAKHWPGVPIYEDIRTLSADALRRDGIAVDAICGGFPCQDLSHAGKRAGLEGERSGLWGEYRRLIGEIRPRFVIVENVPGMLSLGMGTVLGDLAALGYDAVWDCIPASAVGAPHRRDRVWVVAVAARARLSKRDGAGASPTGQPFSEPGRGSGLQHDGAHTQSDRRREARGDFERSTTRIASGSEVLADASRTIRKSVRAIEGREQSGLADQGGGQFERGLGGMVDGFPDRLDGGQWLEEPEGIPRVIKGQESRAHRLKALGNAVVPQVVLVAGRAIMQAEAA